MTTTRLLTADDLARLTPEPGYRYELFRGTVRRMAAEGARHGAIGFEVGRRLGNHVVERGLGRLFTSDTRFFIERDPDVIAMPDVAFVREERIPPGETPEGYVPVVPDLAVGVVSPTDRWVDVEEKVALYLDNGVPLVWLFVPRLRVVRVYAAGKPVEELGEDEVLNGGDVVPGFGLVIRDVLD
jgi:Uma2 family endonuclease